MIPYIASASCFSFSFLYFRIAQCLVKFKRSMTFDFFQRGEGERRGGLSPDVEMAAVLFINIGLHRLAQYSSRTAVNGYCTWSSEKDILPTESVLPLFNGFIIGFWVPTGKQEQKV